MDLGEPGGRGGEGPPNLKKCCYIYICILILVIFFVVIVLLVPTFLYFFHFGPYILFLLFLGTKLINA